MASGVLELARRYRDLLAAVAFAGVGLLPGDGDAPSSTTSVGAAALVLVWSLPIALRRRRPLAVLVVVAAGTAASGALGHPVTVAWLALALAAYSLAASREPRVAISAVVACTTIALAAPLLRGESVPNESFFGGLLLMALPTLLGDRVYSRRVAAATATRNERARIARELHDSVAHALSVMVVQADAADAMLDRDTARARAALGAIRDTGRVSLGEMRRLVGAIRTEDDRSPAPGIRELPALVEEIRGGGIDVTLAVEGEPRPLSPIVDLSAYRIVQEALTNVRRHARAMHASVVMRFGADGLHVEVTDDGRGPSGGGGGHGLIGMGERARLCGGTLRAGAREGGGFEVVVDLPAGRAP